MEIATSLMGLAEMHPELEWQEIMAATVAVRGSGADYLVDAAQHLLEIAGRSRRSDFEVARGQRKFKG